jgi:hypothetical protein
MPRAVQIIFGLIGLALIVYVVLLGVAAVFDWVNPGASSGRMARLTIGAIIGMIGAVAFVYFRRLRR